MRSENAEASGDDGDGDGDELDDNVPESFNLGSGNRNAAVNQVGSHMGVISGGLLSRNRTPVGSPLFVRF